MSYDLGYASAPVGDAAPFGADRRTVLRSVAAMSLVGVGATLLSACSSSSAASTLNTSAPSTSPAGSSAAGSTPAASTAAGSSPAASTAAGSSHAASAAAGATTLVAVAKVPVGGGTLVEFAGAPVVVVQPKAGTFAAYSAVCPHQGCTVSSADSSVIVCGCHNSQFSVTDGSVVSGPSPSGLPKIPVTIKDGNVVATA